VIRSTAARFVAQDNSSTVYVNPFANENDTDDTLDEVASPYPIAATLTFFRAIFSVAPGSGKSYALTFNINGSDTAATVTVADSALSAEWTGSVAIAAGDLVAVKMVPTGTPAGTIAGLSIEVDSATNYASAYHSADIVSGATNYFSPFSAGQATTETAVATTMPMAGTLTSLWGRLHDGIGAQTVVLTVYKNGTAQDGTGGTQDSRITLNSAGTTVDSVSLSISFSAGDTFSVEVDSTAGGNTRLISANVSIDAAVAGQSVSALTSGSVGTGYINWERTQNDAWFILASNLDITSGPTAFTLSDFYARLETAPGAGTSRTFALAVDEVDTAMSVTISDAATTGSDLADDVSVPAGSILNYHGTASGSPASSATAHFSMVQTVAVPIRGSFVAGTTTRVTVSRSAAFGLDNAENTHAEPGVFKVFGQVKATDTVTVVDKALGTGAVAGQQLVIGRNSSGSGAASCLVMTDLNGTKHYFWVDATGDWRKHTAAPTEDGTTVSDTAGTVIGTQS
jgi:hypothetical protein